MHKVIKVNNLTKEFKLRSNRNVLSGLFRPNYNYKTAVNKISFDIEQNEAVAFLGPNGAGKTTTTKMLTGLIKPTSGQVSVLGYEPFDKKADFLKSIGLVMGNKAGLNWDLTALQSFDLLQQIYDISDKNYKHMLNELVELLNVRSVLGKQIRKLSLGERMKLEIIGSLLHNPEILFLDEPTIGLDVSAKSKMRQFLKQLHNSGKTILLTSHDMDDIAEVCDRVIIINGGIIVFDGSMNDLSKKYASKRYIKIEFEKEVPKNIDFSDSAEIIKIKKSSIVLTTQADDVMKVIDKMPSNSSIKDISIESTPLDTIINDLYQAS